MTNRNHAREIPIDEVEQRCRDLASEGFSVFEIGKPMDEVDFFRQTRLAYPMDPPISGNVHWDAFSDSLFGGLDASGASKIVLAIRDASELRSSCPRTYALAMNCILDAMEEVASEKAEAGDTEAALLLVVGI